MGHSGMTTRCLQYSKKLGKPKWATRWTTRHQGRVWMRTECSPLCETMVPTTATVYANFPLSELPLQHCMSMMTKTSIWECYNHFTGMSKAWESQLIQVLRRTQVKIQLDFTICHERGLQDWQTLKNCTLKVHESRKWIVQWCTQCAFSKDFSSLFVFSLCLRASESLLLNSILITLVVVYRRNSNLEKLKRGFFCSGKPPSLFPSWG
jgi:hypothetical protein